MEGLSLSLRQKRILLMLQSRTDFVTSGEIASSLHVSSRTIRNDIREMNELLAPFYAVIDSVNSKGFRLRAEDPQQLRKITRLDTAFMSREGRIRHLAYRLCLADEPLPLPDLEDEMFISRSALLADVNVLKRQVSHEPPCIRVHLRRNRISFEQDEDKIRAVLLSLVHKDWDFRHGENVYYRNRLLDDRLLRVLSEQTPVILYRYGILLDDPTLVALELAAAIMHARCSEGHISPEQAEPPDAASPAGMAAKDLFALIEATTGCTYPAAEYCRITRFIENVTLSPKDWELCVRSNPEAEAAELGQVRHYLTEIRSVFHVDFSEDQEFIDILLVFLRQLIAGNSVFAHLHDLPEIKERLSAEYELAVLYQRLSPGYLGRFLSDPELCSLATCFSGAIRHYLALHPELKLKAVLLTHRNIANAWSLKRKILETFDLYLTITDVLPFNGYTHFDFSDTDLILSTVEKEITSAPHVATVIIDDRPSAGMEENAMPIKLQSFKKIWPAPPFSIRALFENALWIEGAECTAPLQAIEMLGAGLVRRGIATEQHILDITQREMRSTFATRSGVVFLHSVIPAKETKLSVLTLKHRLRWNDFRVRHVIMAVFGKEDLGLLFHLKVLLTSDALPAADTKEELLEALS